VFDPTVGHDELWPVQHQF